MAAGVGAGILGAAHLDSGDGREFGIAAADVIVGITSVALGIRGIVVGGREPKAGTTSASGGTRGIELGMTPTFTSPAGHPGFGLLLQAGSKLHPQIAQITRIDLATD